MAYTLGIRSLNPGHSRRADIPGHHTLAEHPTLAAVLRWATVFAMASVGAEAARNFLAKLLDITLHNEPGSDDLTRGESVFSVQTADSFFERQPVSGEWIRGLLPGWHDFVHYLRSLFPFTYWIGRYNLQWLLGDVVAGGSLSYFLNHIINALVKTSRSALLPCPKG